MLLKVSYNGGFLTTPIDSITAGQIAAGAGIHRSSFYRYFTDVYQVLDAFQKELLDELATKIENILGTTAITLPEYTSKTAVVLMAYADRLYRLLNYKDSSFMGAFIEKLHPNLEHALHISECHIDKEYLQNYIISVMLSNFNFWYAHREQYSLEQVNSMGQKILLHGISSCY